VQCKSYGRITFGKPANGDNQTAVLFLVQFGDTYCHADNWQAYNSLVWDASMVPYARIYLQHIRSTWSPEIDQTHKQEQKFTSKNANKKYQNPGEHFLQSSS
jgi:hypothetical protein